MASPAVVTVLTMLLSWAGGLKTLEQPGSVSRKGEVDMVEIGDLVLVESEKVGTATRSGVVTAVDGPLITVKWDSGSSSMFVPSAGCLQVTGHESQAEATDSS
jgi:hypothetical protein